MFVLLSIAVLLNFSLGLFVFLKHPTRWSHRAFALCASACATWSLGILFAIYSDHGLFRLCAARSTFASGALIVYSLALLFESFPDPARFPASRPLASFGVLAFLFVPLSFTDLVVTSVTPTSFGVSVTYGPLHAVYIIFWLSCIALTIGSNLIRLRHSRGRERTQLTYLALGLLIPGLLAITTNLLVPLIFRTSRLSNYGPLFSLVMIGLVAHAIVRHHVMDMRVVVRKGVVYAASFIISGLILITLILLSDYVLGTSKLGLISDVILGLVVAFAFDPLKQTLQHMFDRYLYRGDYDYQKTIKRASAELARMLTLPSLFVCLGDTIITALRPEWMTVYLRDHLIPTQYSLVFRWPDSHHSAPDHLTDAHSALPGAVASSTAAVSGDIQEVASHAAEMKQMGADLALPLRDQDGLMGFVLLGPKLSGDAYFSDDIDLLSTLANQAGVAIKNAQLYEQVVLINEYLNNIVGTIETGVIAVNRSEHVTIFNRAAEQLTGLAAASVHGAAISGVPSVLADPLRAVAADGQQRVLPEVALAQPDGSSLPVICLTSPLRDPAGGLLGAVTVFSDLTPLKQLETERHRAERLAYFESLAAGIAHEIKNPLVAIQTFTQLLPRKFQDEQFRERFGRIVEREIGRMGRLVDRLRALAKPDGRPHHVLDLRGPITDALELLHPRLDEKRIVTVWAPGTDAYPVRGDPAALEQLFLNLFINALEAMEPGGTLTVRLARGRDVVVVEIEDTGPGVPEDLQARIFDPFVTTKLHGSGLGLAICASIAAAHHARIRVANKSGQPGAVFALEFPAEAMVPART